MVVTVEDEVEDGDNNVVRVPLELAVLDANDNAPIFSMVCTIARLMPSFADNAKVRVSLSRIFDASFSWFAEIV